MDIALIEMSGCKAITSIDFSNSIVFLLLERGDNRMPLIMSLYSNLYFDHYWFSPLS